MSWSVFQVRRRILKWILKRIGNQWRRCRTGKMRSNFLVLVSMRAVAFWACWSFLSWDSVISYNKALPLSRWDSIKAWTSFAAVSSWSTFLISFMFRIWKYVALHTFFFIWASIQSVLSNTIPKLRALGEARISVDAIWRLYVLGLDWWYVEAITRNSVLSSFSFNLLTIIHNFMSLIHDSIFARELFSSL